MHSINWREQQVSFRGRTIRGRATEGFAWLGKQDSDALGSHSQPRSGCECRQSMFGIVLTDAEANERRPAWQLKWRVTLSFQYDGADTRQSHGLHATCVLYNWQGDDGNMLCSERVLHSARRVPKHDPKKKPILTYASSQSAIRTILAFLRLCRDLPVRCIMWLHYHSPFWCRAYDCNLFFFGGRCFGSPSLPLPSELTSGTLPQARCFVSTTWTRYRDILALRLTALAPINPDKSHLCGVARLVATKLDLDRSTSCRSRYLTRTVR